MMDGSEASLECLEVSNDAAFTITECSSLPHSKINTNSSLDFTLGGSWQPLSGSQAPFYVHTHGHVVSWVVSPSKDRAGLPISLQTNLTVSSAEIPMPGWVTLKILLKPVWAAFLTLIATEKLRAYHLESDLHFRCIHWTYRSLISWGFITVLSSFN